MTITTKIQGTDQRPAPGDRILAWLSIEHLRVNRPAGTISYRVSDGRFGTEISLTLSKLIKKPERNERYFFRYWTHRKYRMIDHGEQKPHD